MLMDSCSSGSQTVFVFLGLRLVGPPTYCLTALIVIGISYPPACAPDNELRVIY